MNSRQRRKLEAIEHNKRRIEAHVERVRIEQDKIDNPEKYAKRNRRVMAKVMPFIALSAAAGFSI
tara:strand:+ start:284 stop:478 length:195 start_codon:yes stop_codon:yes gene_type:complete